MLFMVIDIRYYRNVLLSQLFNGWSVLGKVSGSCLLILVIKEFVIKVSKQTKNQKNRNKIINEGEKEIESTLKSSIEWIAILPQ